MIRQLLAADGISERLTRQALLKAYAASQKEEAAHEEQRKAQQCSEDQSTSAAALHDDGEAELVLRIQWADEVVLWAVTLQQQAHSAPLSEVEALVWVEQKIRSQGLIGHADIIHRAVIELLQSRASQEVEKGDVVVNTTSDVLGTVAVHLFRCVS